MTRPARHIRVAALVAVMIALTGCSHLVVLRDPLTASEHNDLGVVYESAGNTTLAAREYRKSVRLESHGGPARVNLGNVQAASGHWRAAEKSYRRALRDSADDGDAMNNLAIALLRQGRSRDEARDWARRAVAVGGAHDSLYRATLDEVDRQAP